MYYDGLFQAFSLKISTHVLVKCNTSCKIIISETGLEFDHFSLVLRKNFKPRLTSHVQVTKFFLVPYS